MFRKHIASLLSAYHHDELTAAERQSVEAHLQVCRECRTANDEIKFGAQLASALRVSSPPDLAWDALSRVETPSKHSRWIPVGALTTVAAALILIIFLKRNIVPAGPAWDVTGMPGISQLHPGDVLETGATKQAQVKIANIGQLRVSPNTRLRLLITKSDEHRIALDNGEVEAQTWAPPRLFIVDTPSASAIDLGCKYSLKVQKDGSSLLHVTLGLVALERKGYETIVPAGAFCRTRKGTGPETPFFEDSSVEFQTALGKVDSLDDGPERAQQLAIVIREAHVRDALSLWHLLPHLNVEGRGVVYDRLSKLLPPPPEVTRDGITRLDPQMLEAWKKVVSQLWQ
jgi:hypothetical protein